MFKIYDGREQFYQWDLNCKLEIEDSSVKQVHFSNKLGNASLVRETYNANGIILVDVPNILLQEDWRLEVYAYDGNRTKHSTSYKVESRTKPEDYIYTEEEISRFQAIEERVTSLEADAEGLESRVTNLEENPVDTFNPFAFGLPVLEMVGDTAAMTKDNAVDLAFTFGERSGNCSVKWQGSSSLTYPKKNYTIKFNNAFEAVEGWGEQKKYCAKANYIDFSHARNLMNAKLWGEIVKYRPNADPRLLALPNCGAVDGFPIIITINGEFQGLYTLNIPKDGWMFGMGNGDKEAIVCADYHVDATRFKAEADLVNDFELEYVSDEDNADWVLTSLNKMLKTVAESNGSDINTIIPKYLDVDSAIDYLIFVSMVGGADMTDKNYILATFDGVKWFFSAYDMDTTYGINYDGAKFFNPYDICTLTHYKQLSKIMEFICRYKTDALKARYQQIRAIVMNEANLHKNFYNFATGIPEVVKMEDAKKWTGLPSTSASNTAQILDWFRIRCGVIDAEINKLVQEPIPDAPIPTEGNIFTYGYDYNDWKLASSGASIPTMIVNSDEGYVEAIGNLDGTSIYLRKTEYPKTANKYSYSCKFSAADPAAVGATRVLLRCLDSSGNVIKASITGFSWLDFYNANYSDFTNQTFTLPENVAKFQFGFLFKSKSGQDYIRVSEVTLEPIKE